MISQTLKLLLLTTLFLLANTPFAKPEASIRDQLMSLLAEEQQILNNLTIDPNHNNPILYYNIIRSKTETLMLIIEQEKEGYAQATPEERAHFGKAAYFPVSNELYQLILTQGKRIISLFGDFKGSHKLYYLLGHNAETLRDERHLEKFYKDAIRTAPNQTRIQKDSYERLSDFFYKKERYKEAVPLYAFLIKSFPIEKQWTKYTHNMAWSLFHTKKYPIALEFMKQTVNYSKKSEYADYKEKALIDIHRFFIKANKIKQGTEFLMDYYHTTSSYLYPLIYEAFKIEKYKDAFWSLEKVNYFVDKWDTDEGTKERYFNELTHEKLKILDVLHEKNNYLMFSKLVYFQYQKYFLKKRFKRSDLEQYNSKNASFTLRKTKDLVKEKFDKKNKRIMTLVKLVMGNLTILTETHEEESVFYKFTQGEIYNYQRLFKTAHKTYLSAFEMSLPKAKSKKHYKEQTTVLNLMIQNIDMDLKLLKKRQLSVTDYIKGFDLYLSQRPKMDESILVYKKFFDFLIDEKKYPLALKVIYNYKRHFPKKDKDQRDMFKAMLGIFANKYDISRYTKYLKIAYRKEFKFSKMELIEFEITRTKITFFIAEKHYKKEDFPQALPLFESLYYDDFASYQVQKDSSLRITLIYHKQFQNKKTVSWATKWVKKMRKDDYPKDIPVVNQLSFELFSRADLSSSAELSYNTLLETCTSSIKSNNELYKNSILHPFAEDKLTESLDNMERFKFCTVSKKVKTQVSKQLLTHTELKNKWTDYKLISKSLLKDQTTKNEVFKSRYSFYKKMKDQREERLRGIIIKKLKKDTLSKNIEKDLKDNIKTIIKIDSFEQEYNKISKTKLSFPEKQYKKSLKTKSDQISSLSTKIIQNANEGDMTASVKSLLLLSEIYESLAHEIVTFFPPINDKKYIKDFKSNMKKIALPFKKQSISHKEKAIKLIMRNDILTGENYGTLPPLDIPISPRYTPFFSGKLTSKVKQ